MNQPSLTSMAALYDVDDLREFFRPNKIQRTSREDGSPAPFPGPRKIQKKGTNFFNLDRFRKGRHIDHVDTDRNTMWEKNFRKLENYLAKYEDTALPVCFTDRELVAWVKEQREAFHNGSLPPAATARLQALNFLFPATGGKNRESQVARLEDPNQGTARAVSAAPGPATSLRYQRFGMSLPAIENSHLKPPPRSNLRDAVARGSDVASRLQNNPNNQVGVRDNSSRCPPVAAASLKEATRSPKPILERLQPHPPTPEMLGHDAQNATVEAPARLYEEQPTDEQAALNITDETDNMSTLSNDKGDEEESFLEETSIGGILSHTVNSLCCSASAISVRVFNIGLAVVLRLMMIMHVLRNCIAAVKHAYDEEDESTNQNDQQDENDGRVAGEEGEDVPPEQDIAAKLSFFTNIFRQGGMVLWFCIHKVGWLLVFCVAIILGALGFSIGVGITMGYMILRGEIDVPAVNDMLGVHCAKSMNYTY